MIADWQIDVGNDAESLRAIDYTGTRHGAVCVLSRAVRDRDGRTSTVDLYRMDGDARAAQPTRTWRAA